MKFLAALLIFALTAAASAQMRRTQTQFYILITDVSPDQVREAAVHMDAMAEEYHQRTRDFSGVIRTRMPFYLFRNQQEYLAAGGMPGSAGMYVSDGRLLAVAGDQLDDRTWHIVQHEGFHQFAAAVIGGDRPVWLNEGLAEYFGEMLFTGDGFVSGVIPNWRLHRIRTELADKKFLPLVQFMQLGQNQWNANLTIIHYDQAWSLVQYLAHGENGRYQKAFAGLMIALSKNQPFNIAWKEAIGPSRGLEDRWQTYWRNLPDDSTRDLYIQATVARLTSFLSCASLQQQQFATFDGFLSAARAGALKSPADQWLPPHLLAQAITDADDLADRGANWSLGQNRESFDILCDFAGHRWIGTDQLQKGRVVGVEVRRVN